MEKRWKISFFLSKSHGENWIVWKKCSWLCSWIKSLHCDWRHCGRNKDYWWNSRNPLESLVIKGWEIEIDPFQKIEFKDNFWANIPILNNLIIPINPIWALQSYSELLVARAKQFHEDRGKEINNCGTNSLIPQIKVNEETLHHILPQLAKGYFPCVR